MPKNYRLTVADLKAFRPERRFSGAHFSLAIATAPRTGAACVVSKKVASRAVDRNKIKRRVKAALVPLLPSLPHASYVFYAKAGAAAIDFAEAQRDIEKLVARI